MTDLYLRKNPDTAERLLGGELIVMSPSDARLFTLNEVASVLWQAADGCTPLRRIVQETICRDYDVDPETAYADAAEVASGLAARGILFLGDRPL